MRAVFLEIPAHGHVCAPPLIQNGFAWGVGQSLEGHQIMPLTPLLIAVPLPHLNSKLRVGCQIPQRQQCTGV
eukprot:CAMPEP_0174292640 /NCGR_PEP_ID=MMETSP0809-20121228/36117_1 /TAXON_ID=73025 ORGANISM="Eutreptiella gymnastica-like, Strain CCMP1594" /NCGR_SAMPLE_ID=MMETSP0809 /ASSEMBLY_ACC=CAM_ASM_000658 /LENGTH=71 /DNA_ID=CAMNT_0015392861 /DNA_START=35 /DNA_END=250 /DNA_ORIENTATION=-